MKAMSNSKAKRHIKSEAVKALENLIFEQQKARFPNFPYPIKPKYSDSDTNSLTRCVIDYIRYHSGQAERVNSTGFLKDNRKSSIDVLGRTRSIGSTQWIPGNGQTGTSDIHATIKSISIKIEIKCKATGDNKQSEGQRQYQKEIEASGGVYLIVRTFEDFYNWLNEFIK